MFLITDFSDRISNLRPETVGERSVDEELKAFGSQSLLDNSVPVINSASNIEIPSSFATATSSVDTSGLFTSKQGQKRKASKKVRKTEGDEIEHLILQAVANSSAITPVAQMVADTQAKLKGRELLSFNKQIMEVVNAQEEKLLENENV